MKDKANILLIGFGHHARRIYYPMFEKWGKEWDSEIVFGVDLASQKDTIETYLKFAKNKIELLYLSDDPVNKVKLTKNIELELNKVVKNYSINSVIISTEPLSHVVYAKWALQNGLSILMDKPISTKENMVTSFKQAESIIEDHKVLSNLYKKAKNKNPDIVFSLMIQRRYHKAIEKIQDLIKEVFKHTNCPVTAIQINHGDGQWRTPNEIIDIDYHGFNHGFGVCSHSGYHFFDTLLCLLESAEKKGSEINNVDVFANFLNPSDLMAQLNFGDYKKLFSRFNRYNFYTEKEYLRAVKEYGEVDVFTSFTFKHDKMNVTLGTVNLLHNNFSQRGWLNLKGRDLYKGNGRLRHESYQVNQGPFQTIYYFSFQGQEVAPDKVEGIYGIGGEYHADIHVFRNNVFNPRWKNYEYFGVKNLSEKIMEGGSRGHIEDAKRFCIKEFVDCVNRRIKREHLKSEFDSHFKSTLLLSGVYQSNTKRLRNGNPLINIRF